MSRLREKVLRLETEAETINSLRILLDVSPQSCRDEPFLLFKKKRSE